jgi:hypothetical protein
MPKCLFCLLEKPSLTREHIIPAALGGNLFLPNATCKECQEQCNKSFEHRFLKGSNFVALLRSFLGIRGRRNEPIYGFDQHGEPLTVSVQPGFPPIRVGLASGRLTYPMQVVLTTQEMQVLSYHYLPNQIRRPITKQLFDDIVEKRCEDAKVAAFWADGDTLPVNYWRELSETFVAWANSYDLAAITSTSGAGNARVELSIDWNTEYRNRGLTKICFMYAMSKMKEEKRFSHSFNHSRKYIIEGTPYPPDYWLYSSVVQWNGPFPAEEIFRERQFTYFLATLNLNSNLYSLIRLHNMGLFAVKLASSADGVVCRDTITMYLLEEDGNNRILKEEECLPEEVALFAQAVERTQQL